MYNHLHNRFPLTPQMDWYLFQAHLAEMKKKKVIKQEFVLKCDFNYTTGGKMNDIYPTMSFFDLFTIGNGNKPELNNCLLKK